MTACLNDTGFRRRCFIYNGIRCLAIAGSLALMVYGWGDFGLEFWAGLAVFLGMAMFFQSWLARNLLHSYHCPTCGQYLPLQSSPVPRPIVGRFQHYVPIHYYCPTCDVEWNAGLWP
jgi:hypothetical protein